MSISCSYESKQIVRNDQIHSGKQNCLMTQLDYLVANNTQQPLDRETIDRLHFWQLLYGGFQRAAQAAGEIKQYYDLGGYVLCLRFAGEASIPYVASALAHLKCQPVAEPSLTICIWDSLSTQVKLPLLVSSLLEYTDLMWGINEKGEIPTYNGDRIKTICKLRPAILTVMDTETNIAVQWTNDVAQIPYYEKGAPLMSAINWWNGQLNRQCVHGGAVGNENGGVLLVGKGGSGKSSTALACLNSDLLYVSDDYSLIEPSPQPYAYSLYNTAKLKGVLDLKRFPNLAPLVSNAQKLDSEKALFFLHEHYPAKIIKGFPLKAVLMPKVTGKKDTKLVPTTSSQGLKALAPSTIAQLPGINPRSFSIMAKVVKQLPCYVLEVGTDIPQIPQTISNLLAKL